VPWPTTRRSRLSELLDQREQAARIVERRVLDAERGAHVVFGWTAGGQ
jgi:hypothetical protein